jgi:hypothetical protein
MAECYKCGAYVARGQGYRREVYTGHSTRFYMGRGSSTSTARRYGIHTLCEECAHRGDTGKVLGAVAIAAFILFAVISGGSNSTKTTTTSATASGVTSSSTKEIPVRIHDRKAIATRETAPPPTLFAPLDELRKLTSDTVVLNNRHAPFARVHAGRSLHVIGISTDGASLEIIMNDGRKGIVTASTAEFEADWK